MFLNKTNNFSTISSIGFILFFTILLLAELGQCQKEKKLEMLEQKEIQEDEQQRAIHPKQNATTSREHSDRLSKSEQRNPTEHEQKLNYGQKQALEHAQQLQIEQTTIPKRLDLEQNVTSEHVHQPKHPKTLGELGQSVLFENNTIETDLKVKYNKTIQNDLNIEPIQERGNLTQQLVWISRMFYNQLIDFVPRSASNSACNLQSDLYSQHLRNSTLWAVRMHEASIFSPSGILTGHTNQFGHPNECVETMVPELSVRGRYCLASVEIMTKNRQSEDGKYEIDWLENAWKVISQNHSELIKHPRSYFRWGICIPAQCSAHDLEGGLNQALSRGFRHSQVSVRVSVLPEYCYVKDDLGEMPWEAWCLIGFVCFLVAFVIWSTVWDYLHSSPKPKTSLSYTRAFSAIYNTRRLCKVDKSEETTIIYGIKFLTMITMVVGHKIILLVGNNAQNKDRVERDTVNLAFLYFLNGSLLVDTFFVISGFLSASQLLQHFNRTKKSTFLLVVLDRLVRILPSYGLVIAFYVWLFPYLNEGPLWKAIVLRESNRCRNNWYTNVLFINNFINDDQMCMLQSWFLAVDFQLFLISFGLIYLCWKWPSFQKFLLGTCLLFSVLVPAVLVHQKNEWSFFIPSIANLHDPTQVPHFRDLYTKSYTRAIPYILGIIGAFYMQHLQEKQFKFSSAINKSLILIVVVFGAHIMFLVPFLFVAPDYEYNVWHHVFYAPIHRLIWALLVCSVIVVHNTGGFGVLSMFLGCRIFAPLSRLCYGVYLTHVAIMLTELGSSHTSEYITLIGLGQGIAGDLCLSLMVSFVLNLLIESPLDTFHKKLKRTILSKSDATSKMQVYPISAALPGLDRRLYPKPSSDIPRFRTGSEHNVIDP